MKNGPLLTKVLQAQAERDAALSRVAAYLDHYEAELPSPTIGPVFPNEGNGLPLRISDLRLLLKAAQERG